MWYVRYKPFIAYLFVAGEVRTDYYDKVLWVDGNGLYLEHPLHQYEFTTRQSTLVVKERKATIAI